MCKGFLEKHDAKLHAKQGHDVYQIKDMKKFQEHLNKNRKQVEKL